VSTVCQRTLMNVRLLLIVVMGLITVKSVGSLYAQEMPVPILVQARYFKKVFAYNKSLPKDQIKIVIVYADASAEDKDDLVQAFSSAGMNASAVKTGQLASQSGVHVVYAAPGVDIKVVREFCRTNGVLSITGVPKWVKDGEISIGLDVVNDQPKVLVNAERLKAERQDAADLLRLR